MYPVPPLVFYVSVSVCPCQSMLVSVSYLISPGPASISTLKCLLRVHVQYQVKQAVGVSPLVVIP